MAAATLDGPGEEGAGETRCLNSGLNPGPEPWT